MYSQIAKHTNPDLLGWIDPQETIGIPFVGILTPYGPKSTRKISTTRNTRTDGRNGPVVTSQRSDDALSGFDRN